MPIMRTQVIHAHLDAAPKKEKAALIFRTAFKTLVTPPSLAAAKQI